MNRYSFLHRRTKSKAPPPPPPEFISVGSYGAVISPPVKCNAPIPINIDNKISKLMELDDAESQMNEVNLEDDRDPEEKYHIGNPILCKKPDLTDSRLQNQKIKELISKIPEDRVVALYYKNGGKSLYSWLFYHLDEFVELLPQFMEALKVFFEGFEEKHENGSIHADVKVKNVVFDGKTIRLIDYGLSFQILSINGSPNYIIPMMSTSFTDEYYYYAWPPESVILQLQRKRLDELLGNYVNKFNEISYVQKIENNTDELLNEVEWCRNQIIIDTNVILIPWEEKDGSSVHIFSKFDSYGLGVLLQTVVNVVLHHYSIADHKIRVMLDGLNNIAIRMSHPLFSHRLDIVDAKQEYDELIQENDFISL